MFDGILTELRVGLRMLVKDPGFTSVTVLSLALGIGANTAIFTLVDAVMLRMLPVSHPEQLISLRMTDSGDMSVARSAMAMAAVVMVGVTILAGLGPARRASRIDPMVALREE